MNNISDVDYRNCIQYALKDPKIAAMMGRETLYAALERKAREIKRPGDSFERAFAKAVETREGEALYSAYSQAEKPKNRWKDREESVAKDARQARNIMAEEGLLDDYEALKRSYLEGF